LAGRGAHAQQSGWLVAGIAKGVRSIRGNVDGLTSPGDELLTPERDLNLSFEDAEHLFKVVAVRRRSASGWDVHINERVFAGTVITRHEDRIGVPDEAEMGE